MPSDAEELKKLIAIALEYNPKQDFIPKVVATGKGEIANNIIQKAKEHNITIHSDEQLAAILSVMKLNEYIPFEAYNTVARIMALLLRKGIKR